MLMYIIFLLLTENQGDMSYLSKLKSKLVHYITVFIYLCYSSLEFNKSTLAKRRIIVAKIPSDHS